MTDTTKVDDQDGPRNTRPDSDIFEDETVTGFEDDDAPVDVGEIGKDETTLDDQIAVDRDAAKAGGEDDDVPDDDDGVLVEDDVDEGEPKKQAYGKRAEKAIGRANSGKKAAEARASKAERELADLREKDGQARGQQAKSYVKQFDDAVTEKEAAIARLQDDLERAQENGDSKETARIMRDMSRTEVDIRENTYYRTRAQEDADEYDRTEETRSRGNGRAETTIYPETERWKERNESWFGGRATGDETEAAVSVERIVAANHRRGAFAHGPDTREYWNEVDRRLKVEMPDLDVAEFEEEDDDPGPRPRPTNKRRAAAKVSGARRGTPSNNKSVAQSAGRVVITNLDKQTMRSFKMDPNNPADLKQYADEKRRLGPDTSEDGRE